MIRSHHSGNDTESTLPEVYALLVATSRAAARARLDEEARARLLAIVLDGLAPRPATAPPRRLPMTIQLSPLRARSDVLSGRARPSFPRVAPATARRETRRPMSSTTTTAGSDTDRQAIRDVLADLYKAWAAGDADAFVADYTEDATVVQPGVYKKDREEIRTTMAAAFAGPLSGTRATDRPSSIRFLTDDTAIVVSEGGIIFPGQDAVASEGLIRATWVLVRRDGGWRIASYHNSPVS
jgi:uncharacterized protein (TIGR02246 family)